MKISKPFRIQLAVGGALVLAFAGCQTAPPASPGTAENALNRAGRVVREPGAPATAADPGQAVPGQTLPGDAATVPGLQPGATATPSAKLTGQVIDEAGLPIVGAVVNTFGGFTATTDAQGMFTVDALAGDNLVFDFAHDTHLARQLVTSLTPKGEGIVKVTLKAQDSGPAMIDPATGGVIKSADGNAILEIPPGALAGRTEVRVSWLNPLPSSDFPEQYGQLPGPLLTRDTDGQKLSLSPLGFANLQFGQATLAPGAQATLRMKVTPEALKQGAALGMPVDFNNPSNLQQPCYEYDRTTGLWVNPATSRLEKDAAGETWFVYTVHGKESPKNFKSLLQIAEDGDFVTGQRTIKTEVKKTVYELWIGGTFLGTYASAQEAEDDCYEAVADVLGRRRNPNCDVKVKTTTTVVTTVEDVYGKYLRGNVTERSSNAAYNNRKMANAAVSHNSDFFGGTRKWTDEAGNFRIPVKETVNNIGVNGASWAGASSTGGGWNMIIPTDGRVKASITGGALAMTATGSNLTAESWSGTINKAASRASQISLAPPAAPRYLKEGAKTMSGGVPTAGELDLGQFTILRDYAIRVVETVRGTDNADQPNKATNGAGVAKAALTGFTDYLTGRAGGTTGADGGFTFTLLGDAAAPKVTGTYLSLSGSTTAPGTITLNTDVTYTLDLDLAEGGEKVGEALSITYYVDGKKYTTRKTIEAGNKITLTFARDTADDKLTVKLEYLGGLKSVASSLPSPVTLGTAESKADSIKLIVNSAK